VADETDLEQRQCKVLCILFLQLFIHNRLLAGNKLYTDLSYTQLHTNAHNFTHTQFHTPTHTHTFIHDRLLVGSKLRTELSYTKFIACREQAAY
jgi:hypothetical protein